MFRNYLAAALRNLVRNKLYAAINIIGLALGVSAALLIALFVRSEYTYDRFFPGYQDVYLLTETKDPIDRRLATELWDISFPDLAAKLSVQFPQMAAIARIMPASNPPHIRQGQVEADEARFVWADPSFFEIMPLKQLAGDLQRALATPDTVVLTRTAARKYFGRDTPLGEFLEIDPAMGPDAAKASTAFSMPHAMRVTAIIEDLPPNSYLKGDVFGSSLSSSSTFALYELTPDKGPFRMNAYTFIRLRPNASLQQLREDLADFAIQNAQVYPPGFTVGLHLTPIADLHLAPPSALSLSPRGDRTILHALIAIAVLVVAAASFNFVALTTARASQRAIETGVRKSSGALRAQLIIQFLGEAIVYVILAMALGIALSQSLLPQLNAVLNQKIAFSSLGDFSVLGALLIATIVLGLAAGAYPAFVLSAYRPAEVLKGTFVSSSSGGFVRRSLVVLQFAIMIGLGIAAATVWRQTLFSLDDQLRVDGSRVLLIKNACPPFNRVFRERLAAVPGVDGAVCGNLDVFFNGGMIVSARAEGREAPMVSGAVDYGALEFYGLRPLAGRFFDHDHGDDGRLVAGDTTGNPSIVINETAMRQLGFGSPSEAIGKIVTWNRRTWSAKPTTGTVGSSEVIGVAPDFALDTRRNPYGQVIYVDTNVFDVLSVRLDGSQIPEALTAIDTLWSQTMPARIDRRFFEPKTSGYVRRYHSPRNRNKSWRRSCCRARRLRIVWSVISFG